MIDVQLATTGSDGSFRFVCPDPQDPQLELHVETTHARFESVVFVLHRRDGVRGFWRQVEASARKVRTLRPPFPQRKSLLLPHFFYLAD